MALLNDRSGLDVFSKMPLKENPVHYTDTLLPVVQIFFFNTDGKWWDVQQGQIMYIDLTSSFCFPYLPFLCADMYMCSNSVQFLKTDSAIILRLGLLKCETVEGDIRQGLKLPKIT